MDRHITFERLHNVRDVGGYATADGTPVAWRRLYRADSLGKLAGEDLRRFRELGVRTVIDLRYDFEIARDGRVPDDDVAYHHLSIEKLPYDQAGLAASVDPVATYADKNLEVAVDGAAEIRAALDVIADPGAAPVVVHCTSGKDRTGLIIALVLGLLGVSDTDVIDDYALTERATERLRADQVARHPELEALWPGYGTAPADAMRRTIDGIIDAYGSWRGYAAKVLEIGDAEVSALRAALT